MQVPTYARYLKDILNKKRPMQSMDVVKLTEAILTQVPEKKDPGIPTISFSFGTQECDHA